MLALLRAAPQVVVLVGESAFIALTGSSIGSRTSPTVLYQAAFDVAAQQSGYRIQTLLRRSIAPSTKRAVEAGETFWMPSYTMRINGTPTSRTVAFFKAAREEGRLAMNLAEMGRLLR